MDFSLDKFFLDTKYEEQEFNFDGVTQKLFALDSSSTDHDLTGQIIWEAAEILSKFIIKHSDMWEGKNILELGSGAGLCGLLISRYAKATILSDY
jgi:predicted nicotinamide N-methyase